MNTRIQVEHPVTEMITGMDLVKEQLMVAAQGQLSFGQQDVQLTGHAIECRINAENPETFIPSPGKIVSFHAPGGPGVRFDSHIYNQYTIPYHYDSMIAKLICHGKTRDIAIARMKNALNELIVDGIQTNIPLHQKILNDPGFVAGDFTIHYLEKQILSHHEGETL